MHQEWLGHNVTQEAEAWDDAAEARGLGLDVNELDLEHIARLRPLDEHRPGERVDSAGVHVHECGLGGSRTQLAVDGVAGLEYHLLAFGHFQHGLDVGMVAVVPGVGLIGQGLAAIDADGVHGGPPGGTCLD